MTMTKYVPYEKLSKKKQRAMNAKRRETWSISPVTRKPANPKAYNRKKAQDWKSDSSSVPFFFSFFGFRRLKGMLGNQTIVQIRSNKNQLYKSPPWQVRKNVI